MIELHRDARIAGRLFYLLLDIGRFKLGIRCLCGNLFALPGRISAKLRLPFHDVSGVLREGETGGNYLPASFMVLGVFLGSATWWLTLSTGVSLLREKFTPVLLTWVNRLAGVVIFVFGLLALFWENQ